MMKQMIEQQIIKRGIKDKKVIEAMLKVPRHEFISGELRDAAYDDEPLPIGGGQTISQPFIVAYMTEALGLKGGEKVLEIGAGSGYQTAIIAEIAKEVYSVEIIEHLALKAGKILKKLGYKNISIKTGDGNMGWPEHAPYDAIMVTAAPVEVPGPLMEQLAEGGRMIIPVGDAQQELVLVQKRLGKISQKNLIPVRFVPMKGNA
jgi:protein-L-isoaspartate(D-aspartate) O-methyltransferase